MANRTLAALTFILATPIATAGAQTSTGKDGIVTAVAECRRIGDDAKRLSCFDRATELLAKAQESGEIMVVDRQRTVERKRARFGLAMNEADERAAALDPTEVREQVSTVAAVTPGGYARFNLTLANGAIWQTVEPLRFPPKVGDAITIRSGTLGTFKASVPGLATIKVKRLR
jgi:hypothetical protein